MTDKLVDRSTLTGLGDAREQFNENVVAIAGEVELSAENLKHMSAALSLPAAEVKRILTPPSADAITIESIEQFMNMEVPPGRIVTYKTVAAGLGLPNHYRQVANILASARGIEKWACRIFHSDRTTKQGYLTSPNWIETGKDSEPDREHWLIQAGFDPDEVMIFKTGYISLRQGLEYVPSN